MATQKPISTISYNSEAFLREKLDTLVQAHIIQCYTYICHKGEDGDKDHIHLRIEPNKKLDPMDITDMLKEYDKTHPDKPLGVRPWRPSKEEDWVLYAVHEERYLQAKYRGGEKGEKLPYKWQDIKANEGYDTETAYIRALSYMEHTTTNIATRLQDGAKPLDLVLQGENVYTVNALMRTLSVTDYERLNRDYQQALAQIALYEYALDRAGLVVSVDDNGEAILTDKAKQFDITPCEAPPFD